MCVTPQQGGVVRNVGLTPGLFVTVAGRCMYAQALPYMCARLPSGGWGWSALLGGVLSVLLIPA